MPALVETRVEGQVALCTLNRPEARNALSPGLREELAESVERYDADDQVNCIVIAGNDEAFAAGADVKALSERSINDELSPSESFWRRMAAVRKPMIAAVSGWALGGGCELALTCDMIVRLRVGRVRPARDHARDHPRRRGHPAPGARDRQAARDGARPDGAALQRRGGQRLGIVNKISKRDEWLTDAMELAAVIARRPPLAARLAKQAVLAAEETGLTAGVEAERRLFGVAMATEDRVEAMQAFLEKRRPDFRGQ